MQRVGGMTQLDVQCAACSLRLWERLAVQACAQRSNGYTHVTAAMLALLCRAGQPKPDAACIPSVLHTLARCQVDKNGVSRPPGV